eukprot:1248351-Rhodomonas_salina.1
MMMEKIKRGHQCNLADLTRKSVLDNHVLARRQNSSFSGINFPSSVTMYVTVIENLLVVTVPSDVLINHQ